MLTSYLLHHRLRPAIGSATWIKYWTKRLRLLPQLCCLESRLASLQWRGAQIGELTTVSPADIGGRMSNLSIGSNCAIGRVSIQLHDRVEIGDHVVINDGARLLTGTHNTGSAEWELIATPIRIHDYAWVATDALILPGVEIGRGAVVAAGAVVTKSVSPLEIVGGNPARPIGTRGADQFSYQPTRGVALFEAWLGRPSN